MHPHGKTGCARPWLSILFITVVKFSIKNLLKSLLRLASLQPKSIYTHHFSLLLSSLPCFRYFLKQLLTQKNISGMTRRRATMMRRKAVILGYLAGALSNLFTRTVMGWNTCLAWILYWGCHKLRKELLPKLIWDYSWESYLPVFVKVSRNSLVTRMKIHAIQWGVVDIVLVQVPH